MSGRRNANRLSFSGVNEGILAASLDAIIVADAEGHIVEWNPAAERMFGWSRDKVLGQTLGETVVPADFRDAHDAGMERYRNTGEAVVLGSRLELFAVGADREPFPIELAIERIDSPGGGDYFVAFIRDLSEAKERERERQLGNFSLEHAMDAVFWIDCEGRFVRVNQSACAGLGYDPEELVGRHVWDIDPDYRPASWSDHWERIKSQRTLRIRSTHRRKDGTLFPVSISINYFDLEGQEYNCAIVRDISAADSYEREIESARANAVAANAFKERLLATVSHDLRTPASAILSYAEILGESIPANARDRALSSRIHQNARFLLNLIEDLVDLSALQAGRFTLRDEDVSMKELTEAVANAVDVEAERKKISFEGSVHPDVPGLIRSDGIRLKRILLNLVGNAIKYTDSGGVSLRVCRSPDESDRLQFIVEDTGLGIAPDKLERIFEAFDQVGGRYARQGLGLGLFIARALTRNLGGDISVTSEVGVGSRFQVDLPLVVSENLAFQGSSRATRLRADDQRHLSGLRILVADDDRDHREIARYFLEAAGAEVVFAHDGREVLHLFADPDAHEGRFDVGLFDVQMPFVDGYEAVQTLREMGVDLPVIAVTASADAADVRRYVGIGFNDVLQKPIRAEDLTQTILSAAGPRPGHPEPVGALPQVVIVSERAQDESFAPLLASYMQSLVGTRRSLGEARRRADRDEVLQLVHRLKGTAGSYGFPQLSEHASVCQDALRDEGDSSELEAIFEELFRLLDGALAGADMPPATEASRSDSQSDRHGAE